MQLLPGRVYHSTMKTTLISTIAIILTSLTIAGCDVIEELPTYEQSSLVKVGDEAPTFSATLIDGTAISLEDYRGEYVTLILFSHTCPDCKRLLDDLHLGEPPTSEWTQSNDTTSKILTIGRDATPQQLIEFCRENNYTVAMAADENRAIFNLYATTYVPRVYIINPQGIIEKMYIESDTQEL